MPDVQQPSTVELEGDYVCVRYCDPELFDEIRSPEWAEKASGSVVDGSEIQVGTRSGAGDWVPQEVLIPEPVDPEDACRQANEILQRIDY